ncbi:transposase [Burkholderia cepacia]|uniref:transposase n=1 Tax=Burkholderia cepacia TaxID=292 RepID=UPI001CF1ABC6|nr:transposase [Burkholderia cepacia]
MDEPNYHFQWTRLPFMTSIKLRSRAKVLASYSVRAIRFLDGAIRSNAVDVVFVCISEIVTEDGGPSIAPRKLIRVLQVQVLYSIPNQSTLMKKVSYSMLCCWFVTSSKDDVMRDHSTVRRNRDRLLEDGANVGLFNETVDTARTCGYLQGENFSVDCTLIQVWARDGSFVRESKFVVGTTLPAMGDKYVLAIGDRADLLPDGREGALPLTAQVVKQRTEHLATHRSAWLDGKPMQPFAFHDFGALVSICDYDSFGTLEQFGFFRNCFIRGGRFVQLGHLIFDRRHQRVLHGFSRRPGGGLPNGSTAACSRALARRDTACGDIA